LGQVRNQAREQILIRGHGATGCTPRGSKGTGAALLDSAPVVASC
jgi:hypothetical protein